MSSVSSILSLLAVAGLLVLAAGVGLAVLAASQGKPARSGIGLAAAGLVVGVVFGLISQGVVIVQPQEIAVVFNTLSGDLESPRTAGTHVVIPVIQEVTFYPVQQQQYTMAGAGSDGRFDEDDSIRGRTVDGQEIRVDITVIFSIDPSSVNTVHQRWQDRYGTAFIRPTTRGYVRDAVSRFRAQEIYSERRTEMETSAQELLAARMSEEGFILSDLVVRDVTFSSEFTASIERAQISQQEAERARLRVEQRLQEAQQLREQALGERDAQISFAEGQAQSQILLAQAQAQALALISEELAANPLLIQYEYVRKLAQNITLALVPANGPFLFDVPVAATPDAPVE